jgi:hypothetical protein
MSLYGELPLFKRLDLARLDGDHAHGRVVVIEEGSVAVEALCAEKLFGIELAIGAAVLGVALVGDVA